MLEILDSNPGKLPKLSGMCIEAPHLQYTNVCLLGPIPLVYFKLVIFCSGSQGPGDNTIRHLNDFIYSTVLYSMITIMPGGKQFMTISVNSIFVIPGNIK